jgi:hypothetical protein
MKTVTMTPEQAEIAYGDETHAKRAPEQRAHAERYNRWDAQLLACGKVHLVEIDAVANLSDVTWRGTGAETRVVRAVADDDSVALVEHDGVTYHLTRFPDGHVAFVGCVVDDEGERVHDDFLVDWKAVKHASGVYDVLTDEAELDLDLRIDGDDLLSLADALMPHAKTEAAAATIRLGLIADPGPHPGCAEFEPKGQGYRCTNCGASVPIVWGPTFCSETCAREYAEDQDQIESSMAEPSPTMRDFA